MRGLLVAVMLVMLAGCGTMRLDLQGFGHPTGTGLSVEVVSQDGETLVDQDFMVKLDRLWAKVQGYLGRIGKDAAKTTADATVNPPDPDDQ